MKKLLAVIPAVLLFAACTEPPAHDTVMIVPPVSGLVYDCYATKGTEITTPNLHCEGTLYFCKVRTNTVIYHYLDHTIVAKCNNGDYHFNLTDVKFTSKKDK